MKHAALVLALGLLACGAGARRPNFVFIVVDTLRADRLHYAGYAPGRTPHFDALARQSVDFSRAYSATSWTLPSLASIFLSQLGSEHGVVIWGSHLGAAQTTVAELLRQAGYRTAGWSANVLMGAETGIGQGFEHYEVVFDPQVWQQERERGGAFPNASAVALNRRLLAWLERVRAETPDTPFFAYLQYMEPHTPYRCWRERAPGCEEQAARLNRRLMQEHWDFSPEQTARIGALYDDEVARLDAGLGLLLRALRERGFWDDTWLVVTADHGELLGEGGHYLHGKSLSREEIHVPLLVSGPDRRGAVIDAPVSALDLAPTLLDLAGVEQPAPFHGRSLRPLLERGSAPPAPVVAELFQTTLDAPRHRLAVIEAGEKLVMDHAGNVSRYDLQEDPDETHPTPATREDLSRALGAVEKRIDFARGRAPEAPPIAAQTRAYLKALGYDRRPETPDDGESSHQPPSAAIRAGGGEPESGYGR